MSYQIYPQMNLCGPELERLGYDLSVVLKCYDSLFQILGREWFERELKQSRGHLFNAHPLLAVFGTGSTSSVIQALELVLAMNAFRGDPGFSVILSDLGQKAHFEGAFFTLSVALRFRLLQFMVQLEPSNKKGSKGDIAARRGEDRLAVECTSRQGLTVTQTNTELYQKIIRQSAVQNSLLVDIELRDRKNGAEEATHLFKQILKDFHKNGRANRIEGRSVSLAVRELTDLEISHPSLPEDIGRHWDWTNVFAALGSGTSAGENVESVEHFIVVRANESNQSRRAPEEVIDGQLMDKRTQLGRHPEEATSLLFLQTHSDMEQINLERLAGKLRGDHFRSLPGLAAVFLSQRRWTDIGRYYNYRVSFLNERAKKGIPATLCGELEMLEQTFDLARLVKRCHLGFGSPDCLP